MSLGYTSPVQAVSYACHPWVPSASCDAYADHAACLAANPSDSGRNCYDDALAACNAQRATECPGVGVSAVSSFIPSASCSSTVDIRVYIPNGQSQVTIYPADLAQSDRLLLLNPSLSTVGTWSNTPSGRGVIDDCGVWEDLSSVIPGDNNWYGILTAIHTGPSGDTTGCAVQKVTPADPSLPSAQFTYHPVFHLSLGLLSGVTDDYLYYYPVVNGTVALSYQYLDHNARNWDTNPIHHPTECHNVYTAWCGDGILQNGSSGYAGANEQCDLGAQNGQPGSGCNADCTTNGGGGSSYYSCVAGQPSTDCNPYSSLIACQAANPGGSGRNCYPTVEQCTSARNTECPSGGGGGSTYYACVSGQPSTDCNPYSSLGACQTANPGGSGRNCYPTAGQCTTARSTECPGGGGGGGGGSNYYACVAGQPSTDCNPYSSQAACQAANPGVSGRNCYPTVGQCTSARNTECPSSGGGGNNP